MKLYTGIDLHSTNSYVGILDETGKRVFKKKLPNDPGVILNALAQFKNDIVGIVVESTYNWYWLVDLLMAEKYTLHLANPTAMKKYSGLKYADDEHDAFWLAETLRLGILPEGYIYPKEDRPIRDLLRKRGHLVRLRSSLVVSLQNIINRNNGFKLKKNKIMASTTNHVTPYLETNEDLALAGRVSKDSIDFLTRQIKAVEANVEGKVELRKPYANLLTIQGVGKILGLTIMLETGPISRFDKAGNYVSYCRKVSRNGSATTRGRAKETERTATNILLGLFQRLRNWRVAIIRRPAHITTVS